MSLIRTKYEAIIKLWIVNFGPNLIILYWIRLKVLLSPGADVDVKVISRFHHHQAGCLRFDSLDTYLATRSHHDDDDYSLARRFPLYSGFSESGKDVQKWCFSLFKDTLLTFDTFE